MIITFILGFIGFTLFFITIIVNVFFGGTFKKYDFENTIISYINNDLDSKLIYNLNQRYICEEEEEILILGTWFGSSNKCKCGSLIKNESYYKADVRCETIYGDDKKYTKFNGKSICIKRKRKSFKELIKSK